MAGGFTTPSGIEVIRDGPEGAPSGSGARTVFVHGAMDRASSFGRAVRHLKDLCTDRYDRRGYGRSIRLGTGDITQHAADLIEVLGDEPATVVGHSMGGLVAVMAAAERPDLVERVVAYEPPAPWTPWWAAGHHDVLDRADPGDAAEAFLRRMLGDRTWERFPPSLRHERRAEGPALQADLAIGSADPGEFDPSTVSVPVLVGCGDHASDRHRRAAEAMAQDVPNGRLVVLPGADHGAHLSQPKSFANLVRGALPHPRTSHVTADVELPSGGEPSTPTPDESDGRRPPARHPELVSRLWERFRRKPPKTAFVLSGGGNMGALQVGMLRALLERRIRPDLVLGCSIGALNGCALAAEPTLGMVGRLQDVWLDLEDKNVLPQSLFPSTVQLARRGTAVHTAEGLRSVIQSVLQDRWVRFEDLAVPFGCVATDLARAEEHWFDSGPLVEPILASAAIPAVFPPVEIDGVRYLDGAVVNDVPLSRAVELGATKIYALHVGSFDRPRPEPRRPLDVALQAYWIARRHRFKRDLASLPPEVEVIVLPTGDAAALRFNDLRHSDSLIAASYQATTAYLDAAPTDARTPEGANPAQ